MSSATIVVRQPQTWAKGKAGAFAEGLKKHGWEVNPSNAYVKADLVVFWGVAQRDAIQRTKKDGCEVCILERGFILDRFKWTSVSFGGGLNGRGVFQGPFEDSSRWKMHFAQLEQTWKIRDGYALIMEQVPGDNSVRNVDLGAFYNEARQAFEAQGFKVKQRGHPRISPNSHPRDAERAKTSLEEDLAGAQFVVTWNSNAAVDAVLAGVPTITMDPGSMAWDVTTHSLDYPPTMVCRALWEHRLAWCQWTTDEFASGYCWDHVRGDL